MKISMEPPQSESGLMLVGMVIVLVEVVINVRVEMEPLMEMAIVVLVEMEFLGEMVIVVLVEMVTVGELRVLILILGMLVMGEPRIHPM